MALVHEGTIDHLSEAGLIALDETGVQKGKYKKKTLKSETRDISVCKWPFTHNLWLIELK